MENLWSQKMINFVKGDLFESDCEVLVNAVNPIGMMGGGIARQFAIRYPEMEQKYIEACKNGHYNTHNVLFLKSGDKLIANLLTVDENIESNYCLIADSLKAIKNHLPNYYKSLAFPMIGCGIGGLDKEKVKSMFEEILGDCEERIDVYDC